MTESQHEKVMHFYVDLFPRVLRAAWKLEARERIALRLRWEMWRETHYPETLHTSAVVQMKAKA